MALEFPTYVALVTVAVLLRAEPNELLNIRIQFGGTLADIMRQSMRPISITTSQNGLAFIPFHMPQLRFDEPGQYVARVIDIDDDFIIETKSINVIPV